MSAWLACRRVLACQYSCRPSNADQRPSWPRVMFATNTWVCSYGSTARDVRCRNAAASSVMADSNQSGVETLTC